MTHLLTLGASLPFSQVKSQVKNLMICSHIYFVAFLREPVNKKFINLTIITLDFADKTDNTHKICSAFLFSDSSLWSSLGRKISYFCTGYC